MTAPNLYLPKGGRITQKIRGMDARSVVVPIGTIKVPSTGS